MIKRKNRQKKEWGIKGKKTNEWKMDSQLSYRSVSRLDKGSFFCSLCTLVLKNTSTYTEGHAMQLWKRREKKKREDRRRKQKT
jgi:hypothetical protein